MARKKLSELVESPFTFRDTKISFAGQELSKPAGRPAGSKTRERPEAAYRPAQCPSCKSTRREPFRDGPVNQQSCTIEVDGQTYNRQIWRNTRCKDCGQHYRVIEYRYEPGETS